MENSKEPAFVGPIDEKKEEFNLEQFIERMKKLRTEIQFIDQCLREKTTDYNNYLKENFGICDGENFNILQLVEMVRKVAIS